jgi:PAS domain S-box-containing protein
MEHSPTADIVARYPASEQSFQDFEVTHDFPNLGRRTMLLNARRLRRRVDQEDLILLAIEDVTAVRESRERDAFAAAILRCSGEALVGLSPEGVIQSWNPAAERLFGYTAVEILGSSISILAPGNLEAEQSEVLARLRTDGVISTETVRMTKAGRLVTVILNAAPVLDSADHVVGVSVALTDITERKQMEEQLRDSEQNLTTLLEEKQTLVRETHHRVKNNLQTIASLLSLQAGQARDRQVIEALSEAGGRVQAIARLHETLYASETLAEIQFGEYLQNLARELSQVHGRSDVTVQVSTDDMVLSMDVAIPLGLIAHELILNCFKHAFPADRSGQVTISFEYLGDDVKRDEALENSGFRLRVQDDGIGFPPGLDTSKADSLGLRLVHLLAQQLHAEVQALRGVGSTFLVVLSPPAS